MQSSTAAVSVLGIVAVHLCWVAAELYEVQRPIGVIAVTSKAVFLLPCCSTAAAGMHRVLELLLCSCAGLL